VDPKPCFIAAIRHLRGRARYAPLLAIIFACVTHYASTCVATLMAAPAPGPLTGRAALFSGPPRSCDGKLSATRPGRKQTGAQC
jgi:hypothetical protein